MEITNEKFLNEKYNKKLDKLELRKKNTIMEKMQKHKTLSMVVITLIVFSFFNFFLIYNFIKILEHL